MMTPKHVKLTTAPCSTNWQKKQAGDKGHRASEVDETGKERTRPEQTATGCLALNNGQKRIHGKPIQIEECIGRLQLTEHHPRSNERRETRETQSCKRGQTKARRGDIKPKGVQNSGPSRELTNRMDSSKGQLDQKPTEPQEVTLLSMLTNADSLSNKMTELRHRLDNMEIQPDIIAITEAKPKNARFTLTYADYQLKGYEAFTHNVESSTGRGIIIYVRNTLNTVILNLNSAFSEHLILQIRMANNE